MGVVNTLQTNAAPLAHPQSASQVKGQRTKRIRNVVAITNGDSATSVYFLGEVPGTATILSITLEGPTCTGASDCDIGLFDMNGVLKAGQTAAADYYADGLDLTSSTGLPTGDFGQPVWRAGSRAVAKATQQVWQDAGDVEGPFPAVGSTIMAPKYQIGLTLNQGATATHSYVATIEYQCAE